MDSKIETFNMLFQYYESSLNFQMSSIHHLNESTNIEEILFVLEITSLFNLEQLVEGLITHSLEPNINEYNCLYLLHKWYVLLNEGKLEDKTGVFLHMFSKILDYWAFNLKHLVKNCKDILSDLNTQTPNLMRTVVEKCFMLHLFDPYFNNATIVEFLISEGGHSSVFELLEEEKSNDIESEAEYLRENPYTKPTLTWKLNNIRGNIMKETEPFWVENMYWVLSINYFPPQDETIDVKITMKSENKKKQEISNHPSSALKGSIISMATSLNVTPQNHPSNPKYSHIKLQSLIWNTKSLKTLHQIPDEYISQSSNLKIDIYMRI